MNFQKERDARRIVILLFAVLTAVLVLYDRHSRFDILSAKNLVYWATSSLFIFAFGLFGAFRDLRGKLFRSWVGTSIGWFVVTPIAYYFQWYADPKPFLFLNAGSLCMITVWFLMLHLGMKFRIKLNVGKAEELAKQIKPAHSTLLVTDPIERRKNLLEIQRLTGLADPAELATFVSLYGGREWTDYECRELMEEFGK